MRWQEHGPEHSLRAKLQFRWERLITIQRENGGLPPVWNGIPSFTPERFPHITPKLVWNVKWFSGSHLGLSLKYLLPPNKFCLRRNSLEISQLSREAQHSWRLFDIISTSPDLALDQRWYACLHLPIISGGPQCCLPAQQPVVSPWLRQSGGRRIHQTY